MRVSTIALALLLTGLAGVATAAPGGDEEFTLDLSSAGGPTLYLACSNSAGTLTQGCGFLSLWQQTNIAPRLQTGVIAFNGVPLERDAHLLG